MSKVSADNLALARQLFLLESQQASGTQTGSVGLMRVCEKFRQPLSKLTGPAGYASLLSRALALAKAEYPPLLLLVVGAEGVLDGFEQLPQDLPGPDLDKQENPGIVLVAHLLCLLITFIGESLTMALLTEAWAGARFDRTDQETEVKL